MIVTLATSMLLNLQIKSTHCEQKTQLRDTDAKVQTVEQKNDSVTASWVFRNRTYTLTSYFVDPNEPGLQSIVSRTMSSTINQDDRHQQSLVVQTIFSTANGKVSQDSATQVVEEDKTTSEKKTTYVVEGSKKTFVLSEEEHTDGNGVVTRIAQRNPAAVAVEEGVKVLSSQAVCVSSDLPMQNLSGGSGHVFENAVHAFSAYLSRTKASEQALDTCLRSATPTLCDKQVIATNQLVSGIDAAWAGTVTVAELQQLDLTKPAKKSP